MSSRPVRSARRFTAKRSLGQNFLVDPNLQRKIVEALHPELDDEIMEIGPGQGALTRHLVGTPGRLLLVELDDRLAAELEEAYGHRRDVVVLHADFLEIDLERVSKDVGSLKVVGNIPYNLTAPILFRLLEQPRPQEILLMVQREVADRLLAPPGTREYGALAIGVRNVAEVELVLKVPRRAFRPVPRVDSSVVRIRPMVPPPMTPEEEQALRRLTRAAFEWRRKQFQKTLREHVGFELARESVVALEKETGFDLRRRPEEFSPRDFLRLSRILAKREGTAGASHAAPKPVRDDPDSSDRAPQEEGSTRRLADAVDFGADDGDEAVRRREAGAGREGE